MMTSRDILACSQYQIVSLSSTVINSGGIFPFFDRKDLADKGFCNTRPVVIIEHFLGRQSFLSTIISTFHTKI